MENTEQTKINFHGVDIVNVQFVSNKQMNKDTKIDVVSNAKVYYPKDSPKSFKILMDVELESEGFFNLKLVAIGHFELEQEIKSELKNVFVNVNAPAIMFPYLRAFISTFTSNVGNSIQTLLIPVQFFQGDLEEIKEPEN